MQKQHEWKAEEQCGGGDTTTVSDAFFVSFL